MSRRERGRLRIIGGQWRSRHVEFDAVEGLRPTPDRVRQTLFDWLAPRIEGASVLDLFAGSGALGLEALSRGAALVHFVEKGAVQAANLRQALLQFGATDRAEVFNQDARRFLVSPRDRIRQYDLVLLDPPYAADLIGPLLPLLPPSLRSDPRIYVEWPGAARPTLPPYYRWLRDKQAGQVSFGLLTYQQEP